MVLNVFKALDQSEQNIYRFVDIEFPVVVVIQPLKAISESNFWSASNKCLTNFHLRPKCWAEGAIMHAVRGGLFFYDWQVEKYS